MRSLRPRFRSRRSSPRRPTILWRIRSFARPLRLDFRHTHLGRLPLFRNHRARARHLRKLDSSDPSFSHFFGPSRRLWAASLAYHPFPMSAPPQVDVVGVGLNATDTLIPVHAFPAPGSKV